jgi:hypothetical protein
VKAEIRNHVNLTEEAEWVQTDQDYNNKETLANSPDDVEVFVHSVRVKGSPEDLIE